MKLGRYGRIASSMGASMLVQTRNLIISLAVFRLLEDPVVLWGVVNHVNAIVTLLLVPAKLGLEFAAVQVISKFRDDAPRTALQALQQSTVVRTVLAFAFALPMWLFPEAFGDLLGLSEGPALVRAGAWLLVSTSLYEFGAYVVSAGDGFGAMMASRMLFAAVNVALVAWLAGQPGTDAAALVHAQSVSGLVACLYLAWAVTGLARSLAARPTGTASDAPEGRALLVELVTVSVPLTAVAAAGQVFSYFDRVMLPWLSSDAELGSYALASSTVAAALFGTYAFRNVARTRLPGELRRTPDAARATLIATYRASFVVAAWIAAGLVTVAPDLLVAIYGPDAAPAASMLPWFAPYVLLTAHASFSATALVAADRPNAYAVLTAGAAALNVGLNLGLMPIWGGAGALAAATLASVPLAIGAGWQVANAYQHAPLGREALSITVPAALRTTGIAALAALAGALITGPSLLASVTAGLAVTAVFAGLSWLSGEARALRAAL